MNSLEKFLEDRARQMDQQAMMIERYIEMPDKFLGGRKYTAEEIALCKEDAAKCRAALNFLKNEYKKELIK